MSVVRTSQDAQTRSEQMQVNQGVMHYQFRTDTQPPTTHCFPSRPGQYSQSPYKAPLDPVLVEVENGIWRNDVTLPPGSARWECGPNEQNSTVYSTMDAMQKREQSTLAWTQHAVPVSEEQLLSAVEDSVHTRGVDTRNWSRAQAPVIRRIGNAAQARPSNE